MKLLPLAAGIATVALPLLSGCSRSPTIDSSSDEALKASVQEVSSALDPATRKEFESAMQTLLSAGFEGKNLFEMSADAENGGMERRFKATLDGKTASEVIAEAKGVTADRKEKERQAAVVELTRLERKLDDYAQAADLLGKFEVHRSRFTNGSIELAVTNSTDRAVARVYCNATVATPGREIPWVKAPFNYSIPGGMEPGESDTWHLRPNMFSGWSNAPDDRQDTVLTVEVVRLDGAEGQTIFPERFTDADADATRHALARTGGDNRERVAAKLAAWERGRVDDLAQEQRRQVEQEIQEREAELDALTRVQEELTAFTLNSVKYVKNDKHWRLDRELQASMTNGTSHTILYAHYDVRIHSPGREVPWAEGTTRFKFDGGLKPGESGVDSSYPDFLILVPFDKRDDIKIDMALLSLDDASRKTVLALSGQSAETESRLAALRAIADIL